MNYYISDLHLFHKNVTGEGSNFDNRPFKTLDEMHQTIKECWNNTVTNADHVFILGDLAWKENEDAIQFVSTLRGNKHLILGNHCKATDQRYRQLFVEVTNYKEIKDIVDGKQYHVVMSHYPIAFDIKCIAKNVGCMLWDYTPVTLKQILEKEKENN